MKNLLKHTTILFFLAGTCFAQKPSLDTMNVNLVIDGNSLTAGLWGTNRQDISKYMFSWFYPKVKSFEVNSFGISNQTTQQMLSNVKTKICPLVKKGKTNILIANEDINSILIGGVSCKKNFGDFSTYFTEAKSAGFNYCILWNTPYPKRVNGSYSPLFTDSKLNEQKNFFDTIQAVYPKGVDMVADVRSSDVLGGSQGQEYNPLYFHDWMHPTSLGYDFLAQFIINNGVLQLFQLKNIITELKESLFEKEEKPITYYDLQGREVSEPYTGLFLIAVYSDGKRKLIKM